MTCQAVILNVTPDRKMYSQPLLVRKVVLLHVGGKLHCMLLRQICYSLIPSRKVMIRFTC